MGDHWRRAGGAEKTPGRISLHLTMANINRKTANLVAKEPIVTAVSTDGIDEELGNDPKMEQVLTQMLLKWWKRSQQGKKMWQTCHNFLTYGPTVEKYRYNPENRSTEVIICDPFGVVPAPGVFQPA